jgi:hypothetical protein
MKKFLAILLLTISGAALAGPHGYHGSNLGPYHHRHNSGPGWGYWVAPLIIGGVVGSAIANRPAPQTETVIIQQRPIYVPQESCTPWKEIQTPDGRIYRERTCTQ